MYGVGLIPACAGKTSVKCPSLPEAAAHPRVCGENFQEPRVLALGAGSSPRVRGKRFVEGLFPIDVRLIPACAGKTFSDVSLPCPAVAHPRVCGENLQLLVRLSEQLGSSPRVRGKHETGLAVG